jgi:hypothetical protein
MSQFPDEYGQAAGEFSGVTPNVSACKTIGTLNIIFGAGLLLVGLCCGLQLTVQSTVAPAVMAQQQQQFQAIFVQARQKQIEQLKGLEKTAKTDKEKADVQARLKKLQDAPEPKTPDFTKMYAMDDKRVVGYWIADIASGLVLNLLMLVSGIGLVAVHEWGRRLGVWVAVLKIVRLLAVYGFAIVTIVPITTERFIEVMKPMMEEAAVAQGGGAAGPSPAEMAKVIGIMLTSTFVGVIILGAIYPLAAWIVLTRPGVKAACRMPPDQDF